MSHAPATFDRFEEAPRFEIPRWNPALNILAPLAGVILLAAIVAAPTFAGGETRVTSDVGRDASISSPAS